jgi:membrane protein DedA with SNARE-associated domain
MMDAFTHLVAQHGSVALFSLLMLGIVGLPVPEDTLLVFAGVLIYRGHLELAPTMVAAALGSACGISVSYGLGRSLGRLLTKRFGRWLLVTPERVDQVEAWFERVGHWSLFWGYFLPGVRHLTALVAGAAKLRYGDFALFAYGGAVLWSFSFISLGVLAGRGWSRVSAQIHDNLAIAAVLVVALAVLALGVRRILLARK